MISTFISLGIVSCLMLCFKQTQWLGFIGTAILGMMFPITTSVIAILVSIGVFLFKYKKG